MGDSIELKFETPMPVIGQVSTLEAIDHLYSLMVLAHSEWRTDLGVIENWQDLFSTLPGKLLNPDNVLQLTDMHSGSAVEIVKGIAAPVEKLIEFLFLYRNKKQQAQLLQQRDKLQLIAKQLLPLITKMQTRGVSKEKTERMVAKAYQLTEDVLDEMMARNKLTIQNINSSTINKCPACGQSIAT